MAIKKAQSPNPAAAKKTLMSNQDHLKGDKGDKGDTGEPGPQGPKGDPGDITSAIEAVFFQFYVDSAGDLTLNYTSLPDADFSINDNGELEIVYGDA